MSPRSRSLCLGTRTAQEDRCNVKGRGRRDVEIRGLGLGERVRLTARRWFERVSIKPTDAAVVWQRRCGHAAVESSYSVDVLRLDGGGEVGKLVATSAVSST